MDRGERNMGIHSLVLSIIIPSFYCGEKVWRSKNREICKGQARAAKEAGSGHICSHASALGNCLRLSARSTHAVAVDRHRAFIAILSLPSTTTIPPSSSSTMASTSNSTWVPTGRHKVQVGTSLGKALKARKGAVPPKRSNLPERQFYSFRCMSSLVLPLQIAWSLLVLWRLDSKLQARVDRFDQAGDDTGAEE